MSNFESEKEDFGNWLQKWSEAMENGIFNNEVKKEEDSPNPVRKGTEGIDQNLDSKQLGQTFSVEDLKKLEEMKIKLYELESKIATMEDKSYESEVKSIIEKINDLSDKIGKNYK